MIADPLQRIFSRVEPAGDCLNYIGFVGVGGYSKVTYKGITHTVHRWVYTLLIGEVPRELHVDHICNNTRCVNIAHLQAITPRENILRGGCTGAVNARKTHCLNGHAFDKENTYYFGEGKRKRQCVACRKNRSKRYKLDKLEDKQQ